MSSTIRLRNLLDKHGIKWKSKHGKMTMWKVSDPDSGRETRFRAWECYDGNLTVSVENEYDYSPETAVARTLFIATKMNKER